MPESTEISIRTATPEDIDAILGVEESWPASGRASADKFLSRLARFGQGFFLAILPQDAGGEKVVATITSMPVCYDPTHLGEYTSWDEVTGQGYLPEQMDWQRCNGLYIVSGVIDRRYRGLNIFAPMVLQVARLAASMNLRYTLAGAVIPSYRKYCEQHGQIAAGDYCALRRGTHPVDPLLAMYEAIGFSVPDNHHVMADYYPDDASNDYAALVVRDLQKTPL